MILKIILPIFLFVGLAPNKTFAQTKLKISLKDKRKIIEMVLKDRDFSQSLNRVSDGKLLILTKNIPLKIQVNFPVIKGVKFQFITPKNLQKSRARFPNYFAFSNFEVAKSRTLITFTEYNTGSAGTVYSFRKKRGKWIYKVVAYKTGLY